MMPPQEKGTTGYTSFFRDLHGLGWWTVADEALRATEYGWPQVAGKPLRGKATYQSAVP
jgi:hypothetical protein